MRGKSLLNMRVVTNYFILSLLAGNLFAGQSGRINYPFLGIQFTPPAGWQGGVQGEYYLMGSKIESGLLAVTLNPAKNPQQLRIQADQGILDEGVQLNRIGEFTQLGTDGLGAEFEGYFESQQARAFVIGMINPFGSSVTIIALTSEGKYSDKYKALAIDLANSVAFSVPQESSVTAEWKQDLPGRRLSYITSSSSSGPMLYDDNDQSYSSYDGSSSTIYFDLCSDGSFNYYSSSSTTFDNVGGFGYASAQDSSTGSWSIKTLAGGQSELVLAFNDGQQTAYDLSYSDGKTYLDDTRYFRLASEFCS